MPRLLRLLPLAAVTLFPASLLLFANPEPPTSGYNPPLAKASGDAEKATARFQRDSSLKVSVWAAEPMLTHPVALAFDEKGRCYVAETFRHSHGVTDNRSHMNWLDDELAARSVADRVALYKKDAKEKFTQVYEKERDRVRFLEDTKGTGVADRSTVFRDDFGRAEDGIGSGLLARYGNVYYTCIPDLWVLKDTKGTGVADVKQSLSTGYGVHTAFIGHDLHGLRMGPDGKLYFSLGDRGLNVTTKEGKHLFYPDGGAVLRCDLDGANLELVATGLRNPQELAFDDYGNLFTVDNNSDSGDRARFIYIVDGADIGWRIGYQYETSMHDSTVRQGNRGPWNYEKLWHPQHEGQAAYHIPPLSNFADGPSGFTHYPGIGLNDKYKDHFFLCDFRGNSGGSGVWSFTTKKKGASYEMVGQHHFLWNILVTDCEFGPDSALYVSDWVEGWNISGKGRIYKVTDPEASKNAAVAEAKKLLAEGFEKRPTAELAKLLEHPHQQVRLESQYALALRGKDVIDAFKEVATTSKNQLARIHAIWGLGQIGRKESASVATILVGLFQDSDSEIRAQAVKTLGPVNFGSHEGAVVSLLKDTDPRVQFFAAQTLGKGKPTAAGLKGTIELLKQNADKDVYLRHAGIMALTATGEESVVALASHDVPAVRRAAVVALRRLESPQLTAFLKDADPSIIGEAARAINDLPIAKALPALASLISTPGLPNDVMFRVLNANFRVGEAKNALAIAQYAGRSDAPEAIRIMALKMLGSWAKPPRRDYITGLTMSLPSRTGGDEVAAFRSVLTKIFAGSPNVQKEAASVAGKIGVKEVGPFLTQIVADAKASKTTRIEAIQALAALNDKDLAKTVQTAIASEEPKLRNAGRGILAKTQPKEVLTQLKEVLSKDVVLEQQGAIQLLGQIKLAEADDLLETWLDKLMKKEAAEELHLDILEAVAKRNTERLKRRLKQFEESRPKGDELANFREALAGGDAERGRTLFLSHAAGQCQRCHKLDGEGGEVGPALNGLGGKQKRDYLLESIVLPNKQIAKGFESIQITTLDGKTISGVLRGEDATEVRLITAEGKAVTVKKADIDDRKATKTAMPEDLATKLTKSEIRDLVEFLVTLKEEWKKK